MNNSPLYEKEDIVINFRDMLVHILRRWRSIVAGVLVATLLAGGYQYIKDLRAYENKLAAETDQTATIVTLEGASLANANQVLQYQKTYEAQARYNRNSLLMQLDPGAVDTRTLTYLVTGERGYATAAMYQTHLNNLALYEDVATALAPENDPSYIMELVTITLQHEPSTIESADHALLNVKIVAPTQKTCATIADEIKKHITSLRSTVSTALGDHDCRLAADTVQLSADQTLKTTQQNNLNNCNTLRNNLKSAKDALTANEKAYVDQVSAMSSENATTEPTPPSVSKKMVILGFAVGLVLMVCIHGLSYVLDRKLKSREDFAERYGLFVFGCIERNSEKRVPFTECIIRRLFFKKESVLAEEEALVMAQKQLSMSARHAAGTDAPTVYLIGSRADVHEHAQFKMLKDALAASNITFDAIPSPLYNAASLDKLATADAVVLAEALSASTYDDIYRELDVCNRLGCPILGAFILR